VSLRLVSESAFGSLGRALYAFTAIAIGSSLCFPDLAATQPVLASPTIDGAPPDGSSQYPAVSADGRYVAFYSAASNLVPNDTNGKSDVFVRDLQAGTTTRISVTSAGGQATGDSYGSGPVAISGNGRFVAFESRAALVPGTPLTCDSIICGQIYVHDLQTHTTTLASVSNAGITADGMSAEPQLSADGRYVLFSSDAGNLVPHDTNGNHDVFLHDRQTATTTRVSVAADGSQYDGRSDGGLLSGDGNVIIFTTNHLTVAPVARPCRPTFGYYTCWTKTLIDRTKGRENVSDSMGPTYAVNHDGRYAVTAVSDGANGRQWAEYSLYDRVTGQKAASCCSTIARARARSISWPTPGAPSTIRRSPRTAPAPSSRATRTRSPTRTSSRSRWTATRTASPIRGRPSSASIPPMPPTRRSTPTETGSRT
jgi:hypothetical protein